MDHPFSKRLGFTVDEVLNGGSICSIEVDETYHNVNNVVHGGVVYSLVDTGMRVALQSKLEENYTCSTIEIKINYFESIFSGLITCETRIINKGESIANLESVVFCERQLVARANGNFSISKPK